MPKLPANFNWQNSPSHIDLLSKFIKPRDAAQVIKWNDIKETLKEHPKDSVDRFFHQGALVTCDLEEILECVYSTSELKNLAEEEGFKAYKTKSDLAKRLVIANPTRMEKITSKNRVLKCSLQAREVVTSFEQAREDALEEAKQKSFEAMLLGDAESAYKVFLAYQRQYVDPDYESRTFAIQQLAFILTSAPKVLGRLKTSDLKSLRAATGMPVLWYRESSETWLPEDFTSPMKSDKVAISYLKCNADIREAVNSHGEYQSNVKLTFDEYDIESCPLCKNMNGKIFQIADFPDLPLVGCTSETGCKCRVEGFFDEDVDQEEISNESEADEAEVDFAITKLLEIKPILDKFVQLREQHDNGQISDDEFQKNKSDEVRRLKTFLKLWNN